MIGRNEGDRLLACLASVLSMNYPRELLDVVYVDSSSTDGSAALAQSLGVRAIVLSGPTTAARGRNAGWAQTSAPFILFLDGDTVLDKDFVGKNIGHFADPSIAGVFGNRRETRTKESVYNAILDLDWNMEPGWALFFGGDCLVRREALVLVTGYNDQLIAGEEPDMCRRMRGAGYRILHVDEPMTLHDLAMHRFSQYWRRSVRTGYAYAQISSFYANTDDPLWAADSRRNVVRACFWIGAPVLCALLSAVWRSWLPLSIFLLIALALWGRTGIKAARKTRSIRTLVAYSLHSHLQQIPILAGQLRFWLSRASGKGSRLIEYKRSA